MEESKDKKELQNNPSFPNIVPTISLKELVETQPIANLINSFSTAISNQTKDKELDIESQKIELETLKEENAFISSTDKRQKRFIIILFLIITGILILNIYINFINAEIIQTIFVAFISIAIFGFIDLNKLRKSN